MSTPNYLDMSDEAFLNEPQPEKRPEDDKPEGQEQVPVGDEPETTPTPNQEGDEPAGGDEDDPDDEAGDPPEGGDEPEGGQEQKAGEGDSPKAKPDASDTPEGDEQPEGGAKPKEGDEGKKQDDTPKGEVDYKAAYEQLFNTPIKANGREIKIENVDDAVRLIQMGANYNKNMAALKPIRKIAKSLEANGLLDQEKIDYLIDLHLQKPEAIAKLVADSKIDPLDLSSDKASDYKPTSYGVSEQQFALDETLDDLRSTQGYARTLELVSNKWDAASQREVATKPQLFRYLNAHMENGIADRIQQEIDRQEMLGQLSGLSSFEKYTKIGDELHAAGKFADISAKAQTSNKPAPGTVIEPKKVAPKIDDKLNEKRRAAAPSKGSTTKAKSGINPLELPDEEFEKLSRDHFA